MKPMILIAGLTAALALTACDTKEEVPPAPVATASQTAPAPATPAATSEAEQVKVFAETMEAAMQKIPPELRNDFHKYWECEIKANNARPAAEQKSMDGNRVVEMTRALQANRSLANCT